MVKSVAMMTPKRIDPSPKPTNTLMNAEVCSTATIMTPSNRQMANKSSKSVVCDGKVKSDE